MNGLVDRRSSSCTTSRLTSLRPQLTSRKLVLKMDRQVATALRAQCTIFAFGSIMWRKPTSMKLPGILSVTCR